MPGIPSNRRNRRRQKVLYSNVFTDPVIMGLGMTSVLRPENKQSLDEMLEKIIKASLVALLVCIPKKL